MQQEDGTLPTPFGATRSGRNLLAIAQGIRTISESTGDGSDSLAWSAAIGAAKMIVFLGFAFHDQNMSLLIPPDNAEEKRKEIIATSVGISDSNQEGIQAVFSKQFDTAGILRKDLPCSELLGEYSGRLRALLS